MDVDTLLAQSGHLNGDLDLDGEVGFTDFLRLSSNFGETENVRWSLGDFDSSGDVGFIDFLILSANFNDGAVQPVPEPNSMFAYLLAAVLFLSSRSKRSRS